MTTSTPDPVDEPEEEDLPYIDPDPFDPSVSQDPTWIPPDFSQEVS